MKNETEIVNDIKDELSGDEEQIMPEEETTRKPRFVALKVTGIVVGIIAVIALAAYIIVNTPPVKYRISNFYASQGRYIEARDKLHTIKDYKDSDRKYDEYALIITIQYFNSGDMDSAWQWAEWTSCSEYPDIKNAATDYIGKIIEKKNSADAVQQPDEGLIQPAN